MYNVIIFTDITDNIATMPSLGPFKCARVLRKNGYSCLVVNHLSKYLYDELVELIDLTVDKDTFLVGFSTTFLKNTQVEIIPGEPTPHYLPLGMETVFPQGKEFENKVIAYIKEKNNQVKFIAGGAKTSAQYYNKNIDYACIGYSEVSIVQLANHLTKNTLLPNSFKNLLGITIIDDRLAKGYDFANEDLVWEKTDVVNHKALPLEVARGCIFKCRFCNFPMVGKKTLDYVKRPDILQKELEYNYENYGITNYVLGDDTFNDHPEKINLLHAMVKKLKFQPVFGGYHRLDLICTRPESIEQLYEIGVRFMYFGIESLNITAAKAIGKAHDRKKQIKMIEHLRSKYKDLSLHGSFIIGLPGEDIDSCRKTLGYLFCLLYTSDAADE